MAWCTPGGYPRGASSIAGDHRRVVSLLSSPPPDASPLSASAPAVGATFADLRAAVAAQQRQLDSLVDKVASLLSAMHTEVLEDVRKACKARPNSAEDSAAVASVSKDVVHFVDLRETEGGLRAWLQGQLRDAQEHLEARLHEAQYRTAQEVQEVQGCLTGDLHSMRTRLSHLEDLTLDDDDEVAELRRDVDERLEAHAGQVRGLVGSLAEELRQRVEALQPGPDGLRQLADDVRQSLREELRQEAEVRLEAKMTQTFGLTQRLMNELKQELQGQVVQVHEASQHLAHELQRALEAQDLHVRRSLKQLAREGCPEAARGCVDEQIAGCRAAAADCARCASEAAAATDSMVARFHDLAEHLAGELSQDLEEQEVRTKALVQQLLREQAAETQAPRGALPAEAAEAAAQEQLADCARASGAALARAESVEQQLRKLPAQLADELRSDLERQEERIRASLVAVAREAARPEPDVSPRASTRGAAAAGQAEEARFAELEDRLADCRAAAADSVHRASQASARADLVAEQLRSLSEGGEPGGPGAEAEARARLQARAEELRVGLAEEAKRLTAEFPAKAARSLGVPAGSGNEESSAEFEAQSLADGVVRRLSELEQEVAGLRGLLLAMRDQVLGAPEARGERWGGSGDGTASEGSSSAHGVA